MMLYWDAVDLQDVVAHLQSTASCRSVGDAVLHHERAVADYGESKPAVRTWCDVNLKFNSN